MLKGANKDNLANKRLKYDYNWAASASSSSSPVPWLEPEDASPLDSVALLSSSPAPSLLDSPELEVSPLEELS
jgi:hypothetical protein